jgi:hypothetical protein
VEGRDESAREFREIVRYILFEKKCDDSKVTLGHQSTWREIIIVRVRYYPVRIVAPNSHHTDLGRYICYKTA